MYPGKMSSYSKSFTLPDPAATADLACQIGQGLQAGDVILLQGNIGAGKTHFARSLIQSLQENPEDVPSPTFTLVQVYDTTKGELWHADLYRLSSPDECVELGLSEAFETAICLIEWPDKLEDLTPPGALSIQLETLDAAEQRRITFNWQGAGWSERLGELLA